MCESVAAVPYFASVQAGAYRADALEAGSATVENFAPSLDASQIRQKPEAPFRESARAVDLTAAEIIVSVGRGIKEKENIPIVEELAKALGAELAASRPDLRRRLAAHGTPSRQLRANRRAEGLHGRRNFRRDPAPGRHEGREDDRRDQ